ncbi:tigger transposable element derived 6, partial [Trichuris trichiura]
MAKRKEWRELALKEKVDLIRFLETNSQRKTAERFHVSKTTVGNIQRRKREYLERYEKESGDAQRRKRRTSLDQVNEAALHWFKQMRAANARICGPMIQEIARKFAVEFGFTGFQASNGWLAKFKLRYQISQKILCGESREVPVEVLEDFILKFRHFASGFKEEDIFNADECGLFFKAMPDRSLVLKGDKCKSGKLSKERFTVLFCASATGE